MKMTRRLRCSKLALRDILKVYIRSLLEHRADLDLTSFRRGINCLAIACSANGNEHGMLYDEKLEKEKQDKVVQ